MNREVKLARARLLYQGQNNLTNVEADALWPSLPPRSEEPEAEKETETSSATDVEAPGRDSSGRFAPSTR